MTIRSLRLCAVGWLPAVVWASACASSAPAPTAPTASAPAASSGAPAAELVPSVGGLKLGSDLAAVQAALGAPANKAPSYVEGASGITVSEWSWPAQGVTVRLALASDGSATVHGLDVTAPCALRTAEGIGIGSTREAVLAVYGTAVSAPDSSPTFVSIGGPYGGFGFDLVDGKVSGIHLNQGAE
jgi:hypothetical protein